MRKPAAFAMVALIVALLGTSAVLFQKYRVTSANLESTRAAEMAARANYAEAFKSIAEIQDSLNVITLGEGAIRLEPRVSESNRKLTEPSRREALESIAMMGASIQRAKQKIGELEARLSQRGMKIAGLEKAMANLKQTVADQEAKVAMLSGQVDSLQTTVAGLETTVQQDQQTIEEKRSELGTIYYIVGTKQDLTASGVIVAKGGFLGLGKTMQLSGRYDDSLFTAMDTDQQTAVQASAAKLERVKVLSSQPTSSYELKLEGDKVALHILDPKQFRKVRHLVIMTT